MHRPIHHSWFAVLGIFVLSTATLQAQGEAQRVIIDTSDAVELQGSFYPSAKGRNAPCVILLHDFDVKKGGNRAQGGMDALAKEFQKKDYAVLTFDFRGHGQSTRVGKEFWNHAHNTKYIRGINRSDPPTTISHTNFHPYYYPYLVNDLSAAKAYLDRKNDGGTVNTSNLVVVGAGQGATLGVMWMVSEWHRRKAIVPAGLLVPRPFPLCELDDPQGEDQMCGVWLTISTKIAGRSVPIGGWTKLLSKTHEVPQVFVYGKEDAGASQLTQAILANIDSGYRGGKRPMDKKFQFTGKHEIKDTKLQGAQLLGSGFDTADWIVNKYVELIKDDRGIVEQRDRQFEKNVYYWVFGPRTGVLAKDPRISEKAPPPLPVDYLMKVR